MRKTALIIGGTAVALVLGGCAPSLETTIFSQDVAEVIETSNAIDIPATVRIPQPSEDKCRENLQAVVAAFADTLSINGDARCVSERFDNFAQIPVLLSMQLAGDTAARTLLTVELQGVTDENQTTVGIALHMNQSVDELTKTLRASSKEFSFIPSFDPPLVTLNIENDLRGDLIVAPLHVFVDGAPSIPRNDVVNGALSADIEARLLARRDSLSLVLSDVASAELARKGSYVPAILTLP